MRLTTEQRLSALERDNVVLHDTIKPLHKLLKEQRVLINEYIMEQMICANESNGHEEGFCPGEALYTFKCKQKFESLERHIHRMHELMKEPKAGLRAS